MEHVRIGAIRDPITSYWLVTKHQLNNACMPFNLVSQPDRSFYVHYLWKQILQAAVYWILDE